MAYEVEYYHQYYDLGGLLNRIEILSDGFSDTVKTIQYAGGEPVVIRHAGGSKDDFHKTIIQGQELEFLFYCTREDIAEFDALFESNYKDYKIRYYLDDVLEFDGYLKPENLSREYSKNPPYIGINLSATDALADLHDIDFGNGDTISDRESIIEILKEALSPLGIDLNFKIQLGTYESTYMASTDCALEFTEIDCRRFYDWSSGNVEFMSCWDVIEAILKDFTVTLKQYKGYYQITNHKELDSYAFIFDWATLTEQSRTETDNIINLNNYHFKTDIEQQKIRPVNTTKITFRNKDMGGDVTGMDLSDWGNAAVWTIDFSDGHAEAAGVVTLSSDDSTYDEYVQTANFSVTQVTDNDYLKITFNHILDSHTSADPLKSPLIKITVTRPDATTKDLYFVIKSFWQAYESTVHDSLKVIATGNYSVKLSFLQVDGPARWITADFKLKDFAISKIVNSDEAEEGSAVTYDQLFVQSSDKGIDVVEEVTLLADSTQVTEVGALMFYDSALHVTADWRTYGHTEDIALIDIYCRYILNDRYSFKNYLRCSFEDRANTVGFDNIVSIGDESADDTRYYAFLSYKRSFKLGIVTAELIEIIATQQSYNDIIQADLNSIDGVQASNSVSVSIFSAAGSSNHESLTGLLGGAAGDHYHLSGVEYTGTGTGNFVRLASPTLTGTVHAPILHSTTILVDHIGEHTGAHKIVFDNTVMLAASTLIPDGGTIGQAAGPLLTFDDTNNYLEITGCNVAIGDTIANSRLSVKGAAGSSSLARFFNSDYTSGVGSGMIIFTGATTGDTYTAIQAYDAGAGSTNYLILQPTANNVGIGFTAPLSALCINGGLHVGGESAAGDNNLLVDGTCEITGVTTLTGYTKTVGGVHVGGAADPGADNLWVDGISQHPDFVADLGYFGSNWRITAAGDAEFDNVTVRHTLKAFILEVDKIDVVGGRLVVSPASGTVYSWDSVVDEFDEVIYYILVFDTNNDTNPIQFVVGDFVTAQTWKAYDHEVVSSFSGVVIHVTQHATLGSAHIYVTPTTGTPWDGMRLAQMGSTVAGRQSLLYLTSADTNNPFIEGHTGVTDGSFTNTTRKFRLGNLVGITDPTMGALTGYGLYSQNAYLTGRLVLPTAGMTNEGAAASDIRIYAGDTYANRATAPFHVTQDGSLTATGIAELGTAVGNDPESADANAITIIGCNIYEPSRNDDRGSLYINSYGHLGSIDHYRNTFIGDGKTNYLLQAIGQSSVVAPYQAFGFTPRRFSTSLDTSDRLINCLFIMEDAAGDLTLTLPDSDDIVDQFDQGKSSEINPMVVVINADIDNYLTITSKSHESTFYATGSDYTKSYLLSPNSTILMVFAENSVDSVPGGDWYVIES